jgi:Domain of unknown function (DUF4189)
MKLRRTGLALLAFITLGGFVVEGPRGGGTDALDHLERAPRWSQTDGSLIETGARGLGGGIEYVIDDSMCDIDFVDGSDCDDVHAAVAEVLRTWERGHPDLRFVNVTGKVAPGFPLAALGRSGQGAEIDFFAQTGRDFPPFHNALTTGYTMFYENPSASPVTLSNGTAAAYAARIESADVRVNASRCFYIDATQGKPLCLHLPSILLHEIGHALGIGHPEDAPRFNLDSDARPQTAVTIDCKAPAQGLKYSPFYDGAAVLVGRDVQGPGRWRRGLTPDDAAARDALYPSCGILPVARFEGSWGAFAVGAKGLDGRAQYEATELAAVTKATTRCTASGAGKCQLVASFNGCFAYAEDMAGGAAHATSPRSDYARANAVLACAKSGRDCRVTTDFCAFE